MAPYVMKLNQYHNNNTLCKVLVVCGCKVPPLIPILFCNIKFCKAFMLGKAFKGGDIIKIWGLGTQLLLC